MGLRLRLRSICGHSCGCGFDGCVGTGGSVWVTSSSGSFLLYLLKLLVSVLVLMIPR